MGIVVHIVDATIQTNAQDFKKLSTRGKDDVVIELGAMCYGTVQALSDARRLTKPASIDALIFYGHGAAGIQAVSMGKGNQGIDGSKELSTITTANLTNPDFRAALHALAPHFTKKGIIVFHGCHVAEGDQGISFLKKMSTAAGVPVKASNWYQRVGTTELAGNVITVTPSGSVNEDSVEGLKNLANVPSAFGIILLGAELYHRLLRVIQRQ